MTRLGTAKRLLFGMALAAVGAWAIVLPLPGCNTPFIPIPPPGDPTFTPIVTTDGAGGMKTVWETRGAANETMSGARVSIFNADVGVGVIARAQTDGSYLANPIDGRAGDRIEIQYLRPNGENSPEICRVLAAGLVKTSCPR